MDPRTFHYLTKVEFAALTVEDRMRYLRRAMADLHERMTATREQAADIVNKVASPPIS